MNDNDEIPRCFRIGCKADATHHIRLRIWGAGELHLPKNAIECQIPMPLCEQHANEAQLDNLLEISGWAMINNVCVLNGRKPPGNDDVQKIVVPGMPLPDITVSIN